jgi:hypothetical protein
MITVAPEKITRRHRELKAYVYVRQSTLKQVQQNQESRHNQYALVQRAIEPFVGCPSGSISSTATWVSQGKTVSAQGFKAWSLLFRSARLV